MKSFDFLQVERQGTSTLSPILTQLLLSKVHRIKDSFPNLKTSLHSNLLSSPTLGKKYSDDLKQVADLGGARRAPPLSPIFVIFMQFSAKIMPNNSLASFPGVGAPLGNPGSATVTTIF